MKRNYPAALLIPFFALLLSTAADAQKNIDSLFIIRGLSIAAPEPSNLDSFVTFIQQELAPRKANTLLLRVDYRYQYKSHPELVDSGALSEKEVKKIVSACKKSGIRVIPQINLLGHQSWANRTGKLLAVYPQFDETPHVKMPEKYAWPNPEGLYCKSYCPLHPEVHKVVFDLVDEICAVFESDAFHAGMDEVFYLGDDKCPRCSGMDKAELFAGEVRKIRDHLASQKKELWIWGDRLLDGKSTGYGMWEASFNNTHRAIDMIPKDVVICDWHYERPDKSPVYFAMKGLRVITCSWRRPEVAVAQVNDMLLFRQQATSQMKNRFYGVMETVWSGVSSFLNGYYGKNVQTANNQAGNNNTQENCFKALFDQVNRLSTQ
jgi:hypothetical protein